MVLLALYIGMALGVSFFMLPSRGDFVVPYPYIFGEIGVPEA